MAENKNTIVVYRDWIHIFEKLKPSEAGRLIQHFFRYVNDLDPEPSDRMTEITFEPIKQQLKRDLKAWNKKSEDNSKHAKERWEKENMRKHANAYERINSDAKHADKDNDKDNDKDIKKGGRASAKKFHQPTLQEVEIYFKENDFAPDLAKKAFKYYQEANWHDSHGKKVLNWKQKMQSVWFKDENKKNISNGTTKKIIGHNPAETDRLLDALDESERTNGIAVLPAPGGTIHPPGSTG